MSPSAVRNYVRDVLYEVVVGGGVCTMFANICLRSCTIGLRYGFS
jgi:hypothetical protein